MLETYKLLKKIESGINHKVSLSFSLEEEGIFVTANYKNSGLTNRCVWVI